MNTFSIKFTPTQTAAIAAFKQGRVLSETLRLEIDPETLSAEQRDVILTIGSIPSQGSGITLEYYKYQVDGEDIEAVLTAIVVKNAKDLEDRDNKNRDAEQGIINFLSGKSGFCPAHEDDHPLAKKVAEKRAAETEAATKAAAEKKATEETVQAKKAAGIESLRLWASENGGEYIKDLIEGGFNWQEKAMAEYVRQNTPEGFFDVLDRDEYVSCYDIKNPSPLAMQALKAAKAEYGNRVSLLRVAYDVDGVKIHEDNLSVEIDVLGGGTVCVEKFIGIYYPEEN